MPATLRRLLGISALSACVALAIPAIAQTIAITPLARTPAWSVVVIEAMNHALEADPVFANGNYTQRSW